MSAQFISVRQRNGEVCLINADHIQQVWEDDEGAVLRFATHAMLDQQYLNVETFADQLTLHDSLADIVFQLVTIGALHPPFAPMRTGARPPSVEAAP